MMTNKVDLLEMFYSDWTLGMNRSPGSPPGARAKRTIETFKTKLGFISRQLELRHGYKSLVEPSERELMELFQDMRDGKVLKRNGKPFVAPCDYARTYKTFYRWYQRVMRKKGIDVPDIISDLDCTDPKPGFVYLNEKEFRRLANASNAHYRALLWFAYDSGIRPEERVKIRVSDLSKDCKVLNIREEIAKKRSHGRVIKLQLCSGFLQEYITINNLNHTDLLFPKKGPAATKYLKRLAGSLFGDRETLGRNKISQIKMYDIRHCSACYWAPRYKNANGMKFRFGWKKEEKIFYYSELLGMRDTIDDDDMLLDTTKTDLEKSISKLGRENEIMKEKIEQTSQQTQKFFNEAMNKFETLAKAHKEMMSKARE